MNKDASLLVPTDRVFLQLAVVHPVRGLYTYAPPPGYSLQECRQGARMWVPFGSLSRLAIVVAYSSADEPFKGRIRKAKRLLDTEPLITAFELEMAQFIWSYYHLPPGQVLSWFFPPFLRRSVGLPEVPQVPDEEEQGQKQTEPVENIDLTADQKLALDQLGTDFSSFQVKLLQGVTGSGKTEVYLQYVQKLLAQRSSQQRPQVLYLVPEIGLLPQTENYVRKRLSAQNHPVIESLHSGLSTRNRLRVWDRARRGQIDVLIGTRSAIFTPLPGLALIIVDEEHDGSFRSEQKGVYSARDLAIWRASQRSIPIILGSATPALETLIRARSGRYSHIQLRRRVGGDLPPSVHLVDRSDTPSAQLYSNESVDWMRRYLDRDQQVLLYINQRGWARQLVCTGCGWSSQCSRCSVSTVLHMGKNQLLCHHCYSSYSVPDVCPECAQHLTSGGFGTEKIEHWCKSHFGNIPVVRIDSDVAGSMNKLQALLKQVQQQSPALLVATQMFSKGHHFPRLGLIVAADISRNLMHPDMKVMEQSLQGLIQVAGRAGRDIGAGREIEEKCRVLLETTMPHHPMLRYLVSGDYSLVADALLRQRKQAQLPPFWYLARISAESADRGAAFSMLTELKNRCQAMADAHAVVCLGPMPHVIERLKGKWRLLLQMRCAQRSQLHRLLDSASLEADALVREYKGVSYALIVDPQQWY
ncbi:MAG: replication restart helicase PriA [Gammaproteobacteria bacterium]